MAKKIYGYTTRVINGLTKDEDLRQDLWLYLLEGNSIFTIIDRFQKISLKESIYKSMERQYGTKKIL